MGCDTVVTLSVHGRRGEPEQLFHTGWGERAGEGVEAGRR
jgi:hypothetical protein